MPLVDYESEEDEQQSPANSNKTPKRKLSQGEPVGLPSLPDSFHDLYATAVRGGVSDDPSLHEGRKRAIPHIEGNWPSHIYIEWRPDSKAIDILDSVLEELNEVDTTAQITSLFITLLGAAAPLHISLSRSLSLQGEQRKPLLDRLAGVLQVRKVKAFEAGPEALRWVSNYEGNRWFLILQMKRPPRDMFHDLLSACNEVAKDFNQPLLYQAEATTYTHSPKRARLDTMEEKQPSPLVSDAGNPFHISIAWTLHEPDERLRKRTSDLWTTKLEQMRVHVDRLKIKSGNTIYTLPLSANSLNAGAMAGL